MSYTNNTDKVSVVDDNNFPIDGHRLLLKLQLFLIAPCLNQELLFDPDWNGMLLPKDQNHPLAPLFLKYFHQYNGERLLVYSFISSIVHQFISFFRFGPYDNTALTMKLCEQRWNYLKHVYKMPFDQYLTPSFPRSMYNHLWSARNCHLDQEFISWVLLTWDKEDKERVKAICQQFVKSLVEEMVPILKKILFTFVKQQIQKAKESHSKLSNEKELKCSPDMIPLKNKQEHDENVVSNQ